MSELRGTFRQVSGHKMSENKYNGECYFCGYPIFAPNKLKGAAECTHTKFIVGSALKYNGNVFLTWVEGCFDCKQAFEKVLKKFLKARENYHNKRKGSHNKEKY